MKTFAKKSFFLIFLLLGYVSYAQKFSTASAYLDYINQKEKEISKELWDYTSAAAHGKSARKINNRRKDLLNQIKDSKQAISLMSDYNGNKTLRDSTVSHLTMYYRVISEDYEKIMNLEDIAEQSYDNMEAYILAQRVANEKLKESSESFEIAYNGFAASNDITLTKSEDKLYKNLEKASKVYNYYNDVFLILFKSQNQENYLIKAFNDQNMNSLEQSKAALLNFSDEGIKKITIVKAFSGDASIKTSCTQLLKFYNQEAKEKAQTMIDFIIEKEKFNKIKAAFDSKNQSSRTKSDVDQYNKAIKDYNDILNNYNKVNQELNNNRNKFYDSWSNAVKNFLDRQIPKK